MGGAESTRTWGIVIKGMKRPAGVSLSREREARLGAELGSAPEIAYFQQTHPNVTSSHMQGIQGAS